MREAAEHKGRETTTKTSSSWSASASLATSSLLLSLAAIEMALERRLLSARAVRRIDALCSKVFTVLCPESQLETSSKESQSITIASLQGSPTTVWLPDSLMWLDTEPLRPSMCDSTLAADALCLWCAWALWVCGLSSSLHINSCSLVRIRCTGFHIPFPVRFLTCVVIKRSILLT